MKIIITTTVSIPPKIGNDGIIQVNVPMDNGRNPPHYGFESILKATLSNGESSVFTINSIDKFSDVIRPILEAEAILASGGTLTESNK